MEIDVLERRQRAAVEHSGEGGAAGVGDLVVFMRSSCLSFVSTPEVVGDTHLPAAAAAAPRGRRGPRRRMS